MLNVEWVFGLQVRVWQNTDVDWLIAQLRANQEDFKTFQLWNLFSRKVNLYNKESALNGKPKTKHFIYNGYYILYFGILAFCVFRISFAFWSTFIFCAWMIRWDPFKRCIKCPSKCLQFHIFSWNTLWNRSWINNAYVIWQRLLKISQSAVPTNG